MMEKETTAVRSKTKQVWIIVLVNEDGMPFQRANARGVYDDLDSFPTKEEAESHTPAINAKWAFSHVTAKVVSVPEGYIGTPRDC